MSKKGFRVEIPVHIKRDWRTRKVLAEGKLRNASESVPRIARLLALAHKWEGMVRLGEVNNYAEIARLAGISCARVTQVCDLVLLSPDLQVSRALDGILHVGIHDVRRVANKPNWTEQRQAIG